MKKLPSFWGQVQFPNIAGKEQEFWSDLCQRFSLQTIAQAHWYLLWLPDAEPILIDSPPNLIANVIQGRKKNVGAVRLCWLPADNEFAEIQFQGSGKYFRSVIEAIADHLNGVLSEGPPEGD